MAHLKLEGDVISFEVAGWDKLWAFKSILKIPITHITDVCADPNPAMGWFDGLKIIGTGIPHIFKAGTFYQEGEFVFWDVRHPQNTIVIELIHEEFGKQIIEVAEPVAVVNTIIKAIYKHGRHL